MEKTLSKDIVNRDINNLLSIFVALCGTTVVVALRITITVIDSTIYQYILKIFLSSLLSSITYLFCGYKLIT